MYPMVKLLFIVVGIAQLPAPRSPFLCISCVVDSFLFVQCITITMHCVLHVQVERGFTMHYYINALLLTVLAPLLHALGTTMHYYINALLLQCITITMHCTINSTSTTSTGARKCFILHHTIQYIGIATFNFCKKLQKIFSSCALLEGWYPGFGKNCKFGY